jgi:sarcosine oxidase
VHPVVPSLSDVDRSVPAEYLRRAGAVIHEFLPGLYPDPARLQTGVEGYSADGLPYVGLAPDDDRLVITCGFSGSGFKFAPVLGDIAADLAATGKTARDITFLSPGR